MKSLIVRIFGKFVGVMCLPSGNIYVYDFRGSRYWLWRLSVIDSVRIVQ